MQIAMNRPNLFRTKLLRVMKLTTVLLFVFFLQVSANSYSQRVTLNMQNVTLDKVFKEIKKQSGYLFLYKTEELKKVGKVSVFVQNASIDEVVAQALASTDYNYKIIDKTIILEPKQVANPKIVVTSPVITPVNTTITGIVKDEKGNPISGVSISIKGSNRGSTTEADGSFKLVVNTTDKILVVTSLGYEVKELEVSTLKSPLIIVLKGLDVKLDEVVVVGYGTQKKVTVTGSITTVTGADIVKSPTSNVTNSLVGRLTGLSAVQRSGQPGNSEAILNIRGSATYNNTAAIVVIDGVERSGFGDLDPNEIETISILKDAASTAIFGIKGANGVIVITTKSGKEGPPKISYTSNVSLQSYTGIPKAVDAYTNAYLMNEAMVNDGLAPRWTDAELQKFKDGSDPLGYPDVNWFDYLTRKSYLQTQHNLSVSGGTKIVKYYASIGYLFEDGIFKKFDSPFGISSVPNNNRYNFRSNVDFALSQNLTVSVKLGGRLQKRYTPAGLQAGSFSYDNLEGVISRIIQVPSFAYPVMLPDGRIAQNPEVGTNIWNPLAAITRWGTRVDDNNTLESTFNLNYKMDFLTRGLSFKAVFGYDSYFTTTIRRNANWAAYIVDRITKAVTLTSDRTRDEPLGSLNVSYGGNINSNIQTGFNYERNFSKHNFSGLALFTRQELKQSGSGLNAPPRASQGVVGRFSYNYNRKYFAEVNAAYNGSENFAPGFHYGFFPAISAGWTLSNEKFMGKITWLSNLKIRGSYGIVGNDKLDNRFLFLDNYSVNTGGTFGSTSVINSGVQFGLPNSLVTYPVAYQSSIGNPLITWETGTKRNIGLEATLFKKSIEITIDFFDEKRKDILTSRSSGLSAYGLNYPSLNIGQVNNKGYEIEIKYQKSTRNFIYALTTQLSYARNTIINRDEPPGAPDYLKQQGKPVGQFFGYQTDGFYASLDDISKSPFNTLGKVVPGDLKYKDIDGDGQITSNDRTAIGYSRTPEYIFSISPSITYKGISLSLLFQGVTNVSSDVIFNEQNNGMQIYEAQLGRWTPATAETATWPILHNRGNAYISYRTNDFILQDGSYLKLRNAELAWNVPKSILNKLKVKGLRIYVSGQNLITWTRFKMYLDPENINLSNTDFSNRAAYPTSRTYNFGLNIQL